MPVVTKETVEKYLEEIQLGDWEEVAVAAQARALIGTDISAELAWHEDREDYDNRYQLLVGLHDLEVRGYMLG